jgi:hypothetical protein
VSTYAIERCIGGALGLGLLLWLGFVAWICWRDERRARWLQDEADADEFVRALCGDDADQFVFEWAATAVHTAHAPSELDRQREARHIGMLLRRSEWLRRRIDAQPDGPSFDRRELAALEWALDIVRAHSPKPEPRLAFADDVVAVAMLDGPL